jgi:5-hydroxyisourate hydrolase-like protein (transthyretin family)
MINPHKETLDLVVTNKPNGEKIPGIGLNVLIEDNEMNVHSYSKVTNSNGVVSLPLSGFVNGTYVLSVSFVNKMYNASVVNYTLCLGKLDSVISFSASVVFEYGRTGSLYVEVDGGRVDRGNICVVGHPEAKIGLKGNLVSISGLPVGKYTLSVKSTPDENHLSSVGTIGITVKKAVAVIKASKLTVALKKGTFWVVKLVDSKTGNPISNIKLTLKVYTGKKFKNVGVTTNSKGEARYKTSGLSKGVHKVVVSGSHSGYSFNTLSSSISVIKPKDLKFKLKNRINDAEGSLISYLVLDKKTGKGVNGVKINMLIYTGKKAKIISLKTKKDGKFSGAMGFATNELSVGTHKVVVVPASIKYSGSAKTTMIIKKSAKKYQTFSHKL